MAEEQTREEKLKKAKEKQQQTLNKLKMKKAFEGEEANKEKNIEEKVSIKEQTDSISNAQKDRKKSFDLFKTMVSFNSVVGGENFYDERIKRKGLLKKEVLDSEVINYIQTAEKITGKKLTIAEANVFYRDMAEINKKRKKSIQNNPYAAYNDLIFLIHVEDLFYYLYDQKTNNNKKNVNTQLIKQ